MTYETIYMFISLGAIFFASGIFLLSAADYRPALFFLGAFVLSFGIIFLAFFSVELYDLNRAKNIVEFMNSYCGTNYSKEDIYTVGKYADVLFKTKCLTGDVFE